MEVFSLLLVGSDGGSSQDGAFGEFQTQSVLVAARRMAFYNDHKLLVYWFSRLLQSWEEGDGIKTPQSLLFLLRLGHFS